MSLSPRSEIEYRTQWLLERFDAGLPPDVLREQLEGIAAAARRIGYVEHDSLRIALDRAQAWLASDDATPPRSARPHLTLVPPPDS